MRRFAIVAATVVLTGGGVAQPRNPHGEIADLPLIEVRAAGSDSTFAILVTGDGGWAAADRGLASALASHGISLVALDAPRYLARARTPDESARDLARIIRHYASAWGRNRAIVIGYSRGADIVPFMVTRLPDADRRDVVLVALLGPSAWVGFQYHLIDLVASVRRAEDLPVRPEIERLEGTPVVCIYGRYDHNAICPELDPSAAGPVLRQGGHGVSKSEGPALVDTILRHVHGAEPSHREQ